MILFLYVTAFLAAASTAFAPAFVRSVGDCSFVPSLLAPSQQRPLSALQAAPIRDSDQIPARWTQMQAEYQEAIERESSEGLEDIWPDLDDIMLGSFVNAKSAIVRLNEAVRNATKAQQTSAEGSAKKDSDNPNGEIKPDNETAGDCRPLVERLEEMIDWPSNSPEPFTFELYLKNEKNYAISLPVPIRSKNDLQLWLSSTAKTRVEAYQLCITTTQVKPETFRLDRSDITIYDAKTELENKLISLGLKQKPEKERIQEFLEATCKEHVDEWYHHDLVSVEREYLAFQDISAWKQVAYVVSGESGGGKSQYALHLRKRAIMNDKPFDAALYLTLSDYKDQFTHDNRPVPLSQSSLKLYEFLKNRLIPFLDKKQIIDCVCLFNMLTRLNSNRNEWAINNLKQILSFRMLTDTRNWINNVRGPPALASLLVIIDEVGVSLEFAHGLIDSVRTLQKSVFSSQAESVGLVLCGAGVEDVTCLSLTSHPTLGTDPTKSFVTMIGQPNLASFKNLSTQTLPKACSYWDDNIRDAIWDCMQLKGSRTQILSTNMRLLRHGVMPALTSRIVMQEFKAFAGEDYENRVKVHLTKIQENDEYMEFAVRMYASLNGLKTVDISVRKAYLKSTFLFLLLKSLEAAKLCIGRASPTSATAYQNMIDSIHKVLTDEDVKRIMTVGLVTSDPTKTSPAMKYLACEGFSLHVLPGEGKRFENLVARHLFRYYSSLGYNVYRHTLKSQFPLPNQGVNKVDKALTKVLGKKKIDVVIILQPRENNAAGPDIMVLDKTSGKDHQLDLYQVKHLKYPSGFDVDQVQTSLFSLPACRTNAEALETRLNAKIRSRFLQLSSPAAKLRSSTKYDTDGVCLLTLEAVQPT